ncbi:MAG: NADPH:quinone reductase [Cellvibrionales bacterium]
MRAIVFNRFGPASDVLQMTELPTPEPAPGEVLVRLHTSAVNPSDVKKRAGAFPDLLADGFVIPHSDGAGVITAVGPGVEPTRVGERVFVYQAQHGRRYGTAAEYVAVDARRASLLPGSVDFAVGACIGIPIMTAHRCITADGPVTDQWVLVTGGAGRVGHYAIQWARHFGARVIATASNPRDAERCQQAGAEHVVDHRQAGWGAALRRWLGQQPLSRVVDVEFGANLPEVLECISTGGTIVTYGSAAVPEPTLPFRRIMFMDLTVRTVLVYDMPEAAKEMAISDTCALLAQGALQHRIAEVIPLAETALAHELVERGGTDGCVVITTSA